ncbi:hypothetical protein RN001_006830 [Aquatica leii]|uniref:Large ribosomal subunit protein mL46 n=1 Tax=Aquatica leii TaxID=1421715 RepID=A0AAN7PJ41_9COLE|nr:hypothetical protein RN001_006830 [Aquatica leii]
MILRFKNTIPLFINSFSRSIHQTESHNSKWDLLAAVCVERKPIITPLLNDIEQKYHNLLTQIEYENSLKSDHELQHEHDLKQKELLKKGEGDLDMTAKETAQDFLDACNEELAKFKFGDRVTADDKANNIKSLNRKLDRHLTLLIKQKLGNDNLFLFPQGARQDGETLRQTAERVLKESCGSDLKVQFYGNAPCGFYKYTYPNRIKKECNSIGAKVFMYFARYRSGNPFDNSDFKWLDRMELEKELHPKYYNSVSSFLIDEEY